MKKEPKARMNTINNSTISDDSFIRLSSCLNVPKATQITYPINKSIIEKLCDRQEIIETVNRD
jgi:hypothetical protein